MSNSDIESDSENNNPDEVAPSDEEDHRNEVQIQLSLAERLKSFFNEIVQSRWFWRTETEYICPTGHKRSRQDNNIKELEEPVQKKRRETNPGPSDEDVYSNTHSTEDSVVDSKTEMVARREEESKLVVVVQPTLELSNGDSSTDESFRTVIAPFDSSKVNDIEAVINIDDSTSELTQEAQTSCADVEVSGPSIHKKRDCNKKKRN